MDFSELKQGPWEICVESILISRGNYVDDKPDGLWTCWYPDARLLKRDSVYRVRIRIQNVRSTYLFVEASSGNITRETDDRDSFILETPSGSSMTLAIGYLADPNFRDFRNLISETDFMLR